MKYLFLFTITPVQSFIAQARKIQDLFAGSQLLSEMIDFAIEQTKIKTAHFELIFPHINTETKPNRFLALIDGENISKIGQEIQQFVEDKYLTIAEDIIKDADFIEKYKYQLSNHLKIFWIANEFVDNKSYLMQYQQIENLLGGIKNLRTFEQYPEKGRKCSLCGENNALVFSNSYKLPKIWQREIKLINNINLNSGEGLCLVCATKRFYRNENNKKISVPSTAAIASYNIIEELEKNGMWHPSNFKALFDKNFDEQLYYDENLNSMYFEKNGFNEYIDNLPNILENYKKVFSEKKPSSYYAIVLFDADNMGEKLTNEKNCSKEYHQKLSTLLKDYANWAKGYLQKPFGYTIYTGGDDFLGFVNLSYLFIVLKELRIKFDELINENLSEYNLNLTFSSGIVIAHYKHPLADVLQWARQSEKKAKNEQINKDCFCISVLKHSGEVVQAVYPNKIDEYFSIDYLKITYNCFLFRTKLSSYKN